MIQDIRPYKMNNQYKNEKPTSDDIIMIFDGNKLLGKLDSDLNISYPHFSDITDKSICNTKSPINQYKYIYLFEIDNHKYFLAKSVGSIMLGNEIGEMADSQIHNEYESIIEGYEFIGVNIFRTAKPKKEAFAAVTAFHLYGWYRDNSYCGRCASLMEHDSVERMLKCPKCGNMVFPKICPAVIVAVTDKSRILLTKYAGRAYKNYALVAGFNEIGETIEETVEREVLEEVGLHVKNIKYYKSQPWGLSGSILHGFYCELDGSDKITLQEDELSVGEWFEASDIELENDGISLTREMICKFISENSNK